MTIKKLEHDYNFEFNIIKHNLILCIFAFIYDQYLSTTISLSINVYRAHVDIYN
jgi:hypothetical protein